ncbi:Exosome complex component MTR3 [Metarhizium anisopliae]
MSDRRRINGPGGPTNPPVYDEDLIIKPVRIRNNNDVRPFYLKTGVTPSASGSAYLEIDQSTGSGFGMKFTCTVHGPRSLPRSAPFSPHMVISTHVKYAPFATRQRKGYLRDASERDLSIHLETALRGAVIADRWPKSGVEVVVTIVEGDTVLAACCVAYLPARDEITNLWYKGSSCGSHLATYQSLVGRAVLASKGAGKAISVSLNEAALLA